MVITLLLILNVVCWLMGFMLLWSIPDCKKNKPTADYSKVSVIIPARDEEKNLKTLLPSINNQSWPAREIVVVDDHSTDKTLSVAADFGAKVITSQSLPTGWLGKAWACQQGAEAANGELLLFLDADTKLEKDGLARIVATWRVQTGVVSISPYHQVPSIAEQGSAFFNLMQMMGMRTFTVLGKRLRPAGMFGPGLAITKKDYQDIGGHGAVVGRVLENYALTKPLLEKGKSISLVKGKGVLTVRMYPQGMKDVIAGWTKSFASGASQTPPLLMSLIIFWMSGLIMAISGSLAYLAGGPVTEWWLLIYGLFVVQLMVHLKRIGSFSLVTALFYPLPLLFFFYIYVNAMAMKRRGQEILWKGRKIKQ